MKYTFLLTVLLAVVFVSCKKDSQPPYNVNVMAELSVEFDNIAGSADLQLNTGSYINASGESLKITKLKYYVSNFNLTNTNGTEFIVPQDSCYFLIDESDEATHEPILKVPEGEYKTLSFVLGVDSLRSTKDLSQRPGVLNPSEEGAGMYADENSGYLFYNLEGISPASALPGDTFRYHIGGYGGHSSPTVNNIKTITIDLAPRGTPKVKDGKETNIHLMVDVLKMFTGTANVSIATHPLVLFDPYSTSISANFPGMFRHDHTEN